MNQAARLLRNLLDSTCICANDLPPYCCNADCEEKLARQKAEAYLAENPQEISDES